jgi:hypothetical protein
MVENDMRKPIVDWLAADGMEDAHECLLAGYCDVIGFRFHPRTGRPVPPLDCAVAVELKMSNVRQVIMQARWNRPYVNASFAAMPRDRCDRMRPDTLDKFRHAEVGLLAVEAGQVDVVIPAAWENDGRAARRAKTWWRWHLRNLKKQDNMEITNTAANDKHED